MKKIIGKTKFLLFIFKCFKLKLAESFGCKQEEFPTIFFMFSIQKSVTINIGVFSKWLINMCIYSRYANSSYAIFYAGKAEGISRCITVTK